MAIISWRDPKDEAAPLLYLDFDATLLEEYSRAAEVTTYPVEAGGALSDHYQPQQRALSLEVFVSDTPIRDRIQRTDFLGDEQARPATGLTSHKDLTDHLRPHKEPAVGLLSQRLIVANRDRVLPPGQRGATVLAFAGGVTRVVDIFAELQALQDLRQVVSVRIFETTTIDNMAITNLTVPRTPDNGSGLSFTLDLIEMVAAEVTTREVAKTKTRQPSAAKHKPESDGGVIQLETFNITASVEASKLERLEAEQAATAAGWNQAYNDARDGVF